MFDHKVKLLSVLFKIHSK